jgi:hypothetical protein
MKRALNTSNSVVSERRWAKRLWPGQISIILWQQLKQLVVLHQMSVLAGDLAIIGGNWYVTHSGLLRLSARLRCHGIKTQMVRELCDKNAARWAFRATVFRNKSCHGFVGYGDADPSNVSPLVHGAEMRVAETRAVNRALRKAYGIGICSVEEIGSFSGSVQANREPKQPGKLPPQPVNGNGNFKVSHSSNGNGSRVRDRLCQIIRQHQLDANLVKSYAVDFCGTKTLREATREQVESFIVHLADWAEKDRNALLCQLNSYSRSQAGAA